MWPESAGELPEIFARIQSLSISSRNGAKRKPIAPPPMGPSLGLKLRLPPVELATDALGNKPPPSSRR